MNKPQETYQPQSQGKKRLLFALGIAIGVVGVILSLVLVFQRSYSEFEERASSTITYVARQSAIYDLYNYASTSKSAVRGFEAAASLARDIQSDPNILTGSGLSASVSDLRLTGAVVLDGQGAVVSSYYPGGLPQEVTERIESDAVRGVTSHSKKEYFTRVSLSDGSVVDLAAADRLDSSGVVVSLYHTSAAYVDKYYLSIQTLLDGYSLSDNGTIVVESEGQIVASNKQEVIGHTIADGSVADDAVVEALKAQGAQGKLTLVNCESGLYFGVIDQARDNYLYEYVPATHMLSEMAIYAVVFIALYVAVALLIVGSRNRSERKYLSERMEMEKRYSEQLAESAQRAKEANEAKTTFLQRMSHDIRTPINGIIGMVEVAERCSDDLDRQIECRDKIRDASALLLGLVNEILDMSKLESGKIVLDNQPLDLCATVDSIFPVLEQQAAQRGVTFINVPYQIEHRYIVGSATHIKRLVMNILSNAVKYNKPGGTITTSCEETAFDGQNATYLFTCADTGIGMSEEFQKHLFEPFARELSGPGANVNGTGLGMPIARRLAELMGGSITFESQQGVGTTYYIEVTLPVCDASDVAPVADSSEVPSIQGLNVLLVEDNDLNREIAQFLLEDAGAKVTVAENGRVALDVFKASEPGTFDVVLMDVLMPEMNGYEATKALRAINRPDSDLPIIAMTANAFTDDKLAAREAGMDAHLGKPIEASLVIKTLAEHTRAYRASKQAKADAKGTEPSDG